MTKRYKLDRVASVDNRPPPDNNFGPKQMWSVIGLNSGYMVQFTPLAFRSSLGLRPKELLQAKG